MSYLTIRDSLLRTLIATHQLVNSLTVDASSSQLRCHVCKTATGVALELTLDFLLAFVLYSYGVHLPRGRAGGWPFLVVLFAALPVPRLLLNRRGYRRFRREWNERGGFPLQICPSKTDEVTA